MGLVFALALPGGAVGASLETIHGRLPLLMHAPRRRTPCGASGHGKAGNGCFWQVTLWFQSAKLPWALFRQAHACNSYIDGSP